MLSVAEFTDMTDFTAVSANSSLDDVREAIDDAAEKASSR